MDDSNIWGVLQEGFGYITDGPWFSADPFDDLMRVDFDWRNIQTFLKYLFGPVEFIGFGIFPDDAGEETVFDGPFWPVNRKDPYAIHKFYFSKINLSHIGW
jgi:hypothetical protein